MRKSLLLYLLILMTTWSCAQTSSAPTPMLAVRWGVNLNTRLDTLSPLYCDSVQINRHCYKIETDTSYHFHLFPRVYNGMLMFADSAGNVQNIAVKTYSYSYFNGNLNRWGHSNDRELYLPCMAIQNYPKATHVTIQNVECVDLSGRKMNITIPPFKLIKVR